jgi:hypothetical protein
MDSPATSEIDGLYFLKPTLLVQLNILFFFAFEKSLPNVFLFFACSNFLF